MIYSDCSFWILYFTWILIKALFVAEIIKSKNPTVTNLQQLTSKVFLLNKCLKEECDNLKLQLLLRLLQTLN